MLIALFILASFALGVAGTVFAVRGQASAASRWRFVISLVSGVLMCGSIAVYLYEWHIGTRLDASVGFIDRLYIFLRTDRIGSAFNDFALLASFFAVRKARACLVAGNVILFVLWYAIFMGV